jgi:single-stranded-DNA-specific exonuclease
VHRLDACGSLLACDYFRDALDPDMNRVAMYGAIGDFRDTTPLAAEMADRRDKRSLYYEAGTLSQGIEIDYRNRDYKRIIVRYLAANKLPSQIEGLPERGAERGGNDVRRPRRRARDGRRQTHTCTQQGKVPVPDG